MSRVIRTVIALLLLGAGAMTLLIGQAGAVEQGTISVHVTWPDGKPGETVQICFAVTPDASCKVSAPASDTTSTVMFAVAALEMYA